MVKPVGPAVGIPARVPPLVLFAVGAFIAVAIIVGLRDLGAPDAAPWWTYVLLLVPAVVLATLGAAVTVDPRPLAVRRALAGTALAWLLVLAPGALLRASEVGIDATVVALVVLAIVDAAALLALAATTPGVSPDELPGPLGRLGAVVAATRSRPAAIGGPASSRPTRRSAPGSDACSACGASTRTTPRRRSRSTGRRSWTPAFRRSVRRCSKRTCTGSPWRSDWPSASRRSSGSRMSPGSLARRQQASCAGRHAPC
jgi:hypothetical protein